MDDEYQVDCILLIDDDFVTNFINESLLLEMQICQHIEVTDNVEKALQFIESCYLPNAKQKFLLILLDLNMPVWDGFEFLEELESRTELPVHQIDVIILSSSTHSLDTERAKKFNILDYVSKPLTFEKLTAALAKKK